MYLLMKKGLNNEEVKCIKMILNYSDLINKRYPDEAKKWRERIKEGNETRNAARKKDRKN